MIALTEQPSRKTDRLVWQDGFLEIMPAIGRYARRAFCHLRPEACDDAVQEVVANAMVAYVRLFELGKTEVAYASVLVRYGVAQYRTGRRVGTKINCRDVLSPYAQRRKNIHVERLDRCCEQDGDWREALVEDRHSSPADIAAYRIDFADWLAGLSPKHRRIATTLAGGETTILAAKQFRVSAGRISQIRQELRKSWKEFQGETPADEFAEAAA